MSPWSGLVALLLVWFLVPAGRAGAAIPASERTALVALYNSTNGPSWQVRTNWMGAPGTECTWYGVTCALSDTTVAWIHLGDNGLSGPIPSELANLRNTNSIDMSRNSLTGAIPSSVATMTALRDLYLHTNELTGSIPVGFGNLTEMRELDLRWNQLTGPIPPGLGNLRYLSSLGLGGNHLTGTIPSSLGSLGELLLLLLDENELTGEIPASLGNLVALRQLYLNHNHLTGTIPASLGNLALLQVLDLTDNQLTGPIPSSLGNLDKMSRFRIASNQISGEYPPELVVSFLRDLDLRWNAISANDPAVAEYFRQRGTNLAATQTTAPTNVTASLAGPTSVRIGWTPIAYTADPGGYRVLYGTAPGGPYSLVGTTMSKTTSSLTVSGLARGTSYYFVVQAETAPHADNQNLVRSPLSIEVSQTTPFEPVQFSAAAYRASEAVRGVVITVTRTGGQSDALLVDYATSDGTATAGSDYRAQSGTLSFATGQMSRTFLLEIAEDTLAEGTETVNLSLGNPRGGAGLGVPGTAVLSIVDDDLGGTIQLGAATVSVSESGPVAAVSVTRAGGTASGVMVDYATADGTATAGADYRPTSGTLTFGSGQTTVTIPIDIVDDAVGEANETFRLALANARGGATLGARSAATVTIVENERVLQLGAPTYRVGEAGPVATITVKRSALLSGSAAVDYVTSSGTAEAGADYQARAGTLTFGPNVVARAFTIPIVNDTTDEADETLIVQLRNPQGGVLGPVETAVLTIVDNDTAGVIQFGAATYVAAENRESVKLTVTRTGGVASGVSVSFALSGGTATAGEDFTVTGGTLSFAPGATGMSVSVPLLDDLLHEGTETVSYTLRAPAAGATLGPRASAVVTILDDESTLAIAAPVVSVTEGAPAAVSVRRSGSAAGTVTVAYATADGTAQAGTDYAAKSGTLTFGPNVLSRTISVATTGDTVADGDKSFTVTLDSPTGGAALGRQAGATITVKDNDPAGTVQFSAATYTLAESGGVAKITVARPGGTASDVTVRYATADGTAVAGEDYTTAEGLLAFKAGQASATFDVPITNDTVNEGSQTVILVLSDVGGGGALGPRAQAVLTITDNDGPAVQLGAAAYTLAEAAGKATIVVTRKGALASQATVAYATSDGTAEAGKDYTLTSGALTFAAGQASRSFSIPIADDLEDEADETLVIGLTGASGATLGTPSEAVLTIRDDDVSGSVQFAQMAWSKLEGDPGEGSEATITVVRAGGTSSGVTVSFATSNDTAVAGEDYVATSGTLTFQAGQTSASFTVTVNGDAEAEGNEALNLGLSSPTGGATLGALSSAQLWIVEPEGAVALVFVHDPGGASWLSDAGGQLGLTLRDNHYLVSDASSGWGPASALGSTLGDHTDIGHWYEWFGGTSSPAALEELYRERGAHSVYTRLDAPDPSPENEVVVIRSSFASSALAGRPTDPPTVGENPLRGQDAGSEHMTVGNAKGIYNDLLAYFATRPDKLFVVVTAPPLVAGATTVEQAANARALSDWLVSEWLAEYPLRNVAVFDLFNVLTSNGGSAAESDLDRETGNHHRVWGGVVQRVRSLASDVSAYGTGADDSQATAAGERKASAELVALLNVAVNRWRGGGRAAGRSSTAGAAPTGRLSPEAVAPPRK